ncbi:tyrosine--tRNA ligase [Candidatus Pacearchaeota archaeon CG10_big_fil_rev_8_21_14_0_10_34_12]|nr:MAG: tyrosine--tRNA ligase [Candidatus Pacearchaeota archaeon CG10_big_fil_rev_8_21_14_0_10_34_12]
MNVEERLELIRRNTIEIINEDVLMDLLKKRKEPVIYCGYETSGDIHLGHLVSMTKLLDLQKAGLKVKVLFADWHTYLNQKGEWEFINKQLKKWEKGFAASGIRAEFVKGSKIQRNLDYIDDVFKLAVKNTLNRGLRSMQTVARNIEDAKISQVIYPLMQITDFKYLKVDGALGGIEQRKIHMLALETLKEISYKTPFLIHHELIPSLKGPEQGKMSSSIKESMISITDSDVEIKNKINKSYCLEGEINENPILSIAKLIIFPRKKDFEISRDKKFGGNVVFENYEDLENSFKMEKIHPLDLKNSVSKYLQEIIGEIRKNFK